MSDRVTSSSASALAEPQADLAWARFVVAFGAFAYASVAVVGVVMGVPSTADRLQELGVGLVLGLAVVVWRQRPKLAATLAVAIVWGEVTLSMVVTGDTDGAALVAYPPVVAVAGLLYGGRAALVMGAVIGLGVPVQVVGHHFFFGTIDGLSGRDGFVIVVSGLSNLGMGVIGNLAFGQYEIALRASEQARMRYEDLFENAPDGLVAVDADGRVTESNAMAARLLRTDAPALRGRSLVSALQTAGGPAGVEISDARPGAPLMVQFAGSDGSTRVLEISVRSRADTGARGRLISIRDVSEKRQIEERLGHAQRMETVGRLAGGVAHDFNNLLTVIGGNAALLAEDSPPGTSLALEILDAQRRGVALTRQLLSFARREVRNAQTLDIGVMVTDLAQLVERLLGEQHPLRLSCEPGATVLADRSQIEQVVINLVTNARDAMPNGGPVDVRVQSIGRVAAAALGSRLTAPHQVMLEVEDAGCGISNHVRDRMFEPFFTTKARGSGTGLGLATVHGILHQSDGMIALDSAPSFGARFRCFFPLHVAASVDSPTPRWRAAPGEGEQILLVEDDGPVGQLAERLLIRAGYLVTRVVNAEEALAVSKLLNFDLLLTDVIMPGLSGPELATRLRAARPELPVLFMSGYFEPGTKAGHEGEQLSRENLISKPFSSKELLRRVRDMLDARGPA